MCNPSLMGSEPDVLTFTDNKANYGGALSCVDCSGFSADGIHFIRNEGQINGGALDFQATIGVSVRNCLFDQCLARSGDGGALYSFESSKVEIKRSNFYGNRANSGGGGAMFWGFSPTNMKEVKALNDLPIQVEQATVNCENNTARYGNIIGSAVHSLFMLNGPSGGESEVSLKREYKATFDERRYLQSQSRQWSSIAGGQTLNDSNFGHLRVVLVDWYNNIAMSSTDTIKLRVHEDSIGKLSLTGSVEVPAIDGEVTFDNFKVTGIPGTEVKIHFMSPVTSLIRGAPFHAKIRNCTKGEFLNTNLACSKCGKGSYGNEIGDPRSCKVCSAGFFQDSEGQHECTKCPNGKFQEKQEQTICQDCTRGKYTDTSSDKLLCDQCPPGKHGDVDGSCAHCEAGMYSTRNGTQECTKCESGKVTIALGSKECDLCPGGKTTNDQVGQLKCEGECEPGMFKRSTDLRCFKCAAGKFSGAGSSMCLDCPPGRSSSEGDGYDIGNGIGCKECSIGRFSSTPGKEFPCDLCPIGKFAPTKGLKQCNNCPKGTYLNAEDLKEQQRTGEAKIICNDCPAGKWTNLKEGSIQCCPFGAFTQDFTRQSSVQSCTCIEGYPEYFKNKTLFKCYACPEGATCNRVNSTNARLWMKPQNGYWETPASWDIHLDHTFVKCVSPALCTPDGCVKGSDGVLCETCTKGYGKQFGRCVECSSTSTAIFGSSILLGWILLFLAVYWIRKKFKSNRKYISAWRQIVAVLKVNIDFMQINSALPSVLAIQLPENFVQFLKGFEFIEFDFLSMTGATCTGATFIYRFFAMSILPLLGVGIGLFQYFYPQKKNLKDIANEIFILVDEDHSGIIDSNEYNTLVCNFGGKTTTKSFDKQSFFQQLKTLDRDKLMEWWNKQSKFSHALNTTVQVSLLVHTPVTRMVFQYFNCHTVHSRSFLKADYSIELYKPKIQSKIGFLYGSFNRKAEFWEVHEIVRKTMLTGVIIYLQSRPTAQSSLAIMVCMIACCTLNYYQPHKNRIIFWLAQMSFVITGLKFLSSVVLLAAKGNEVESIGYLLIGLDIFFFLGSIIISGIAIYLLWAKIKEIDKTSTQIRPSLITLQDLRLKHGAGSTEYKTAIAGGQQVLR
eukprot:g13914.t1